MSTTDGPESSSAAAVAGLAREVEALRRAVRKAAALQTRVDELAATLAQAVNDLAGAGRRPEPVRPVSWIGQVGASDLAARALAELADWVGRVYLRYPVGRELPDCWLWHPDVVEELAWLHQAWQAAYDPDTGTVGAVAAWHDRYRPGVAHRIRTANRAGGCSLHEHLSPDRPTATSTAPSLDSVEAVARWWAVGRDHDQPPAPTQADIDAADRRLRQARR